MPKQKGETNMQTVEDNRVLNSLRAGLFASVLFVLGCFSAAILLIQP